ncbi:MAG TPA: dienelactone hydrolase family protein [Candidatus Binataceae bacterium]|nr:dienelactone hydrolase family protein [Candidatus Binataceae bacterium]
MAAVAGQVERPELLATQEVSYTSEGARIAGYLARPRENGKYPGLMILHDIFGVSDHARDVARRFANAGFVVLVPDAFSRIELGSDESRARERAAQLDDRLTVRDLDNGAALLRSLPVCNGKVGAVGFCMGGRSALLLAVSSERVDAAVDCWGGSITADTGVSKLHPVPVVDLVKNLKRPVYAVFGAEDQNPSPAHAAELRSRLEREGKLSLVTIESFANAGHAFFADQRPDRYREKAAFELWPKMLAFLRQHLA